MPLFDKDRRKKRREDRRERRKTRVSSAINTTKDIVNEAAKRAERANDEGLSLKRREERLVRRNERVLVIFSEFREETESKAMMTRLYHFIEGAGISMPSGILAASYDRILPVTGPSATLNELVDTLQDALSDRDIDELDLMWHGHGTEADDGTCSYSMADGYTTAADIGAAIEGLDEQRLRMFYTTACYGAALAEEMVESGFSVGAGALGVNTNSTLEFPIFLKNWAAMMPFGVALGDAFNRSRWRVSDNAVKLADRSGRFSDTNSVKATFGDRATNIRSNADF